jgi:valyl-tRNA synthetase
MQHFHDETPKYIRNLRQELNIAMRENLDLRVKLQQKDEEHESGIQGSMIELAETYQHAIKKAERTSQIDQVISTAFEHIDSLNGQQSLKRFVKATLESIGALRKEVLLQSALLQLAEEKQYKQ